MRGDGAIGSDDSGVDESSTNNVKSPTPPASMQQQQPASSSNQHSVKQQQRHYQPSSAVNAAQTAVENLRLTDPHVVKPPSAPPTNITFRRQDTPSSYADDNNKYKRNDSTMSTSIAGGGRASRAPTGQVRIFHEKRDYSHVRSKIAAAIAGEQMDTANNNPTLLSATTTTANTQHARSRSVPRRITYANRLRMSAATPPTLNSNQLLISSEKRQQQGENHAHNLHQLPGTTTPSPSIGAISVASTSNITPHAPHHQHHRVAARIGSTGNFYADGDSQTKHYNSSFYRPRTAQQQTAIQSKIGSLANVTHKPLGGERRIFSERLPQYSSAQAKVGSLQNADHVAGGGNVVIETQTLRWQAEAKIGSLDAIKSASKPSTRQHSPERQ